MRRLLRENMKLTLIALLAAFIPTQAFAVFHDMRISEVYTGSAAVPNAQYVELQMFAPGQNFVLGRPIIVYNAASVEVARFTFPNNVANGADQATILIATSEAQSFFGVTPDLLMTAVMSRSGGKVCFDIVDCVAWGNYTGSASGVGTPFGVIPQGQAMQRRLGANGLLDLTDDTDDSATDFSLAAPTPRNNAGVTPVRRVRADLDGDGDSDIVLRHTSGDIGAWLMSGPNITGGGLVGAAGAYTIGGIADFNGDGKSDILLRDSLGNLGLWLMNGSSIAGGGFVGSPGAYTVAGVGDFDGDGKADILLRDSLGNLGMWLMNGSSIAGGGFVGAPGAYTVAAVADFNGDGKVDILLRDTLGNLGLWVMNGPAITSGAFVGAPGAYTVAGTADFDGDGKADILLRDSLGNLGLWIMNGPTIASGAFVGAPGAYTVAAVGDYNGDGKADILLRDSLGNLGLWIMNGPNITSGHFVGAPGAGYVAY